jgi:hypothetical protein
MEVAEKKKEKPKGTKKRSPSPPPKKSKSSPSPPPRSAAKTKATKRSDDSGSREEGDDGDTNASSKRAESGNDRSGEGSASSHDPPKEPYAPVEYSEVCNERGGDPDKRYRPIEALDPFHVMLTTVAKPTEALLRAYVRDNQKKSGDSLVAMSGIVIDYEERILDLARPYIAAVFPGETTTRKIPLKKLDSGISALCNYYHQKSEVTALQAAIKAFTKAGGQLFRETEGFAVYFSPDRSYSMFGSEAAMELCKKPTSELIKLIKGSKCSLKKQLRGPSDTWGHGLVLMVAMQTIAEKELAEKYSAIRDAKDATELPPMTVRDVRIAYEHLAKHHHFDHCGEASLFLKHILLRLEHLCKDELEKRKANTPAKKGKGGRAKKTASRKDEDEDDVDMSE